MICLKCGTGGELCRYSARKMNKLVLDQIKPKLFQEAKMLKFLILPTVSLLGSPIDRKTAKSINQSINQSINPSCECSCDCEVTCSPKKQANQHGEEFL